MPSSAALPLLLRRRTSTSPSPSAAAILTFLRCMGGGPRTFPGGLNKWKYRRMHEKLAREKERKLLDQEKQLYYSRLRSELRAIAMGEKPPPQSLPSSPRGWISPADQLKALASRFVRKGAEDLWNDDDGPVSSVETPGDTKARTGRKRSGYLKEESGISAWQQIESFYQCTEEGNDPHQLIPPHKSASSTLYSSEQSPYVRKVGSGPQIFPNNRRKDSFPQIEALHQRRGYTTVQARRGRNSRSWYTSRKGWGSDSDSDSSYSIDSGPQRNAGPDRGLCGNRLFEKEKENSESAGRKYGKSTMKTRTKLGTYDMIKTRNLSLDMIEKIDSLQQVQQIRDELEKRRVGRELGENKIVKECLVFSQKRFDECNISPLMIEALTSAGYVQMTAAQEAIVPICLDGKDALIKVRAGNTKTVSYLLSAMEAVLKATMDNKNRRVPPIIALIICPAREIASVVAAEANSLLQCLAGIGVQTLTGGSRFKVDQKCLELNPPQIIVATPGRLLDHIENKSGFSTRLKGLKVFIIDEVNHLLDLGFRTDLEQIMAHLPCERQTLMFSSTISRKVRRVAQLILKASHDFVDAESLVCQAANSRVLQTYIVACNEKHFEIVYHLLKEHVSQEPGYKVVIFCATVMMAEVMSAFLRNMKMNIREMHTRKPPSYRIRISEEFKKAKHLVLVTSDVPTQEMNYPNVTLVLQVGVPPDGEEHINRLRLAESDDDKHGKCILLIAPFEELFLARMELNMGKLQPPTLSSSIEEQVRMAMDKINTRHKEAAYHAFLKFYFSIPDIAMDGAALVNAANKFSASVLLEHPPPILRRTAVKMNLIGIPGITIKR